MIPVSEASIHDLIVVGGGPAGISCALECHENALDVVVLERQERVGGQLPSIPSPVYNYAAGFFENGEKMRDEMDRVAQLFLKDRIRTGCEVLGFNLAEKEVVTSKGKFKGKTILLATGYRIKRLDLPVPSEFTEDIIYRSGPTRESLIGKPIAIIGGGDSAVFTALDLAEYCSRVTVLARSSHLKARPDIVARMNQHKSIDVHTDSVVTKLIGKGKLESVIVSKGSDEFEVNCVKLIAKLGYLPNTDLFCEQLETSRGHVIVNPQFATSVEGVFASGDIVQPGYDRVAFAVGSGMMAARSIRVFLGHTP